MSAVLVTGLTVTQNTVVNMTTAGTHCSYPRRDGQTELAWVAG